MLINRPRPGKDVDWSKVTKTTVPRVTTLPPPVRTKLSNGEITEIMQLNGSPLTSVNVPAVPSKPLVSSSHHNIFKLLGCQHWQSFSLVNFSGEAPKILCYYTSWSSKRPGAGRFEPENLDPFKCTHVIYAFATMKDFQLAPTERSDIDGGIQPGTYERLVKLKEKNPALKVSILEIYLLIILDSLNSKFEIFYSQIVKVVRIFF